MKVSLAWLKDYVDLTGVSPDEISARLTSRGLEVEAMQDLSAGFENVITARIESRDKHPNADKLSFCKVSTGTGEPLGIVCGATNMKAGDIVALAQVGAKLPNGIEIKKSAIRGVESNGMLCSESELKMSEESDGIIILPAGTKLGEPVARVLSREDVVFTLNVTPNRGDCLSHFGVARELAAAFGKPLKKPTLKIPAFSEPGKIELKLQAGDDGSQFFGIGIEGVKIGPSPAWLSQRLQSVGSRSINNVVDATNFVMLEFGHPLHAYDWDKLSGKTLSIRKSKKGENLALLDDTKVALTGEELVIADEKNPVALAGVMGGADSAVSEKTTRVYLECAEFSPVLVRRAAKHFDKHTDAAYRFERGIDPENLAAAVTRLAQVIEETAGGKIVEHTKVKLAQIPKPVVELNPKFISSYLGVDVAEAEIRSIFSSLGFTVSEASGLWKVKVPSYRNDISIKEDLVEEVARHQGYDKIPSHPPKLIHFPEPSETTAVLIEEDLLARAKNTLVALGFHEVVHYSFTSRKWLSQFGLSSDLKIMNPLSEEQEVLVPSLVPGLVTAALYNWNRHFGSHPPSLRFFEIRPTFHLNASEKSPRAISENETGVSEDWRLALFVSGERDSQALSADQSESDFFDLKGMLEQFLASMGARGVRLQPFEAGRISSQGISDSYFHPGRSMLVLAGKDTIGAFGQVHPELHERLEFKRTGFVLELSWTKLSKLLSPKHTPPQFKSWSEWPGMERDFALIVSGDVASEKLVQIAMKAGQPLLKSAFIFDSYEGEKIPKGKRSLAIRLVFQDMTRSIQEPEVKALTDQILEKWKKDLSAELRS